MNRKIKKYGQGGDLGDMIIGGVSTGLNMLLPGVGTLAGMAGNFIKGQIDQKKDKKNTYDGDSMGIYGSTPTGGYRIPNFWKGGTTHEFGKGLSKMNNLKEYFGPRHESGGIIEKSKNGLIEVEGGETRYNDYIFSDRLRDAANGKTFAENSKKIKKKYKSNRDWLKAKTEGLEYKRNQIKNDATKMVVEKTRAEIASNGKKIMMAEMMKSMQGGMPQMADGGPIIPPSGDIDEYLNQIMSPIQNIINQHQPNAAEAMSSYLTQSPYLPYGEEGETKLYPNQDEMNLGRDISELDIDPKKIDEIKKKYPNHKLIYDKKNLGKNYVYLFPARNKQEVIDSLYMIDKDFVSINLNTGKEATLKVGSNGHLNVDRALENPNIYKKDIVYNYQPLTQKNAKRQHLRTEKDMQQSTGMSSFALPQNKLTIPNPNNRKILSPEEEEKRRRSPALAMDKIFENLSQEDIMIVSKDLGDGSSTYRRSSVIPPSKNKDGNNSPGGTIGSSIDGNAPADGNGIAAQLKELFQPDEPSNTDLRKGDKMQIAGSMIAPLYNLTSYMFNEPEIERARANPQGAMAVNNQLNLRARGNYDPIMAQMNSNRSNINQNTSSAMRIAGNVANMTQGYQAINSQATQLSNINAGFRQQGNAMAQQLGEYNRAENVRASIATDQNKAAHNEYLRRGMEQLGTAMSNAGTAFNNNQEQIQMQNIIGSMYESFKIGDDGTVQFDPKKARQQGASSTLTSADANNAGQTSGSMSTSGSTTSTPPASGSSMPLNFEPLSINGLNDLTAIEDHFMGSGVSFMNNFNNVLNR